MTYRQWMAARRLLAEEAFGTRIRENMKREEQAHTRGILALRQEAARDGRR